jgi:hypothetical protein
MLVRSPRRFMILSFIAFVFIFAVVQNSPWAQENVYEQLPPLFKSSSRFNLTEIVGTNGEKIQAHIEDAWQYAIPAKIPSAGGSNEKVSSVASVEAAEPTRTLVVPVHKDKPTGSHPPWVTDPARTEPIAPTFSRPSNMKEYMKKMLKWSRPSWDGHWPPFQDYINKAYDPNRWEQFEM